VSFTYSSAISCPPVITEAEAREKDSNPTLEPGASGGGGGRVREGREGGKGGPRETGILVSDSRRAKKEESESARSGAECAEELPTALVDSWWRPVSDSALDREPRDQSIPLMGRSRGPRDVKISVSDRRRRRRRRRRRHRCVVAAWTSRRHLRVK